MLARYLHSAARAPAAAGAVQLQHARSALFSGQSCVLTQRSGRQQAREFRTCTPVQMGRRSAKIATRKGKADAAKAKLFGKIGKMIAAAVREGGNDAVGNARLRDALAQAKAASCPNDIIERNLKSKDTKDFTEVTYEAYGPGGTGFVMECLTDNLNRTASDVRAAVAKAGGKMADPGSVLFNFTRSGCVVVDAAEGEDKVFEAAMEAGASDVQPDTDEEGAVLAYKVLSAAEDYGAVSHGLAEQGLRIIPEGGGLVWLPLAPVELDDAAFEANEAFLERLLGVDDVDAVYSTAADLV